MNPRDAKREFEFTSRDFGTLREMMMQHTGIQLSENKVDMLYGRLSRRLRKVGMTKFSDYIELLQADEESDEFGEFINAVTTNLTSFFRENHHFEYLKKSLLPKLIKRNQASRRIRIWSAGCSTGEEPYSIAKVVNESMPSGWDVKILATDIDSNVLAHGECGVYDVSRIESLSKSTVKNMFEKNSSYPDKVRAHRKLRDLISFRELNLLETWPMKGPFDIIFCRNVIIYFDMPTKQMLIDRYTNLLAPNGHLFLGHSEAMHQMSTRFSLCEKSTYIKKGH